MTHSTIFKQKKMAMGSDSKRRENASESGIIFPLKYVVVLIVLPVSIAFAVYHLDSFEPADLPLHELVGPTASAPARNGQILSRAVRVGSGDLSAPEDLAYDEEAGLIYTGCEDGWIKKVKVNDSVVVTQWVNTGGRPLGLVLGRDKQLLVADTIKGLLSISREGIVELLSDEAEGLKFKLTDCVDQAQDGMIYFTDASYKYDLEHFVYDVLEGKPHGRLLKYDTNTKETTVLLRDLYFPNGVIVSNDQTHLIYCETTMRRCRKYYLKGEKTGSVEPFVENLPGMPDNIRYDGQGLYWIAIPTEVTPAWGMALKYPFIRKIMAIVLRFVERPNMERNGGAFAVDLDGKPVAHYYDPGLSMVSTAIKIGDHLYFGSVGAPYILRLNLLQDSAHTST